MPLPLFWWKLMYDIEFDLWPLTLTLTFAKKTLEKCYTTHRLLVMVYFYWGISSDYRGLRWHLTLSDLIWPLSMTLTLIAGIWSCLVVMNMSVKFHWGILSNEGFMMVQGDFGLIWPSTLTLATVIQKWYITHHLVVMHILKVLSRCFLLKEKALLYLCILGIFQ